MTRLHIPQEHSRTHQRIGGIDSNQRLLRLLLIFGCIFVLQSEQKVFGGEAASTQQASRAQANFEASYKAAVSSVAEGDWSMAKILFEAALKSLGSHDHPNKIAAKALLKKSKAKIAPATTATPPAPQPTQTEKSTPAEPKPTKPITPAEPKPTKPTTPKKAEDYKNYQEALGAGLNQMEKKQWDAAIISFEAALRFQPGDIAAKGGLKRAKRMVNKSPKPANTKTASGTSEKPAAKAKALPKIIRLDRKVWQNGSGASCYWAGHLLHLDGTELKYRKKLKGDFQISIAIEAQMDHRSRIYLDLRPVEKNQYPKLRAYGSRNGSAPYLEIKKQPAGSGKAKPTKAQITLSLTRAGSRIVFFCNGVQIAETWELPTEAELRLYVGGKGIMNGAGVEVDR